MTMIASTWLGLSVLLCIFAWFAGRLLACMLPLAVALAALAVWLPTGSPRFTPVPKGDYQVLGADIQVDVAIYVLLKQGAGPAIYYRLPYTNGSANSLQKAKDEAGSAGVTAKVNGDGGVAYDGPHPTVSERPKQAETPAIQLP